MRGGRGVGVAAAEPSTPRPRSRRDATPATPQTVPGGPVPARVLAVRRRSESGRRDRRDRRGIERAVDATLEPHARSRHEFQPGRLPGPVHLIENHERLTNDRPPRLKGPAAELRLEPPHGTLRGEADVVRLEFFPRFAFDPHLRVAAAKGYRVPAELNRHVVDIFELV